MLNLARAEWHKISAGRGLLWIMPGVAALFVALLTLQAVLSAPPQREAMLRMLSNLTGSGDGRTVLWTGMAQFAWWLPNGVPGRALMLALAVYVFAGEYQWSTWKNIIPRSSRLSLLLVKSATLIGFAAASCLLYSALLAAGMVIPAALAGGSYGPALTGGVLADFAGDFAQQAFTAILSLAVAVGYATLAAIFTRTMIGGMVLGFGLIFLEAAAWNVLNLLASLLGQPGLVALVRFTLGYNFTNLTYWNMGGFTFTYPELAAYAGPNSPEGSALILLLWVIGLVALSAWIFRRQDITV